MLGETLAEALPRLREQARSRMRDRCRVTRFGNSRYDRATRSVIRDSAEVYVGPCRLAAVNTVRPRGEREGAAAWTVGSATLSLPAGADGTYFDDVGRVAQHGRPWDLCTGDVVEITHSESSPSLVGRSFVVAALPSSSMATAHRYVVEGVDN